MTKLFGKEEVNISRQFEFDFAKAVCILGMVFVHCFEEISDAAATEGGTFYYIMVIVLDSIFGAGTFMTAMGLGIAYSWKNDADKIIKRGIKIFLIAYLLNAMREGIPHTLLVLIGKKEISELTTAFLCNDIMQFAGLALLLFGILKKLKFSDLAVFLTALGMSAIGSFVRFLNFENEFANIIAGLFIGTNTPWDIDASACFPLFNWFIIVIIGYLYGKAIRRCKDINRYYAISTPVSGVILAAYMAIAIPNGLGMMNEDILYYYQFATPNALVLFTGMVFATGLYHFIALPFNDKVKKVITRISSNINRIYCVHWVMIGWIGSAFVLFDYEGIDDIMVAVLGIIIFIASNLIAEAYTRSLEKKKLKLSE